MADMLHVEAIQSRSRLYQWENSAHTNQGPHRILRVSQSPARVHFAPGTEGRVLTFNPRAMLEGGVPETAEALRELFETPRALHLNESETSPRRLGKLVNDLAEEFETPDGAGSPVPLWLVRAIAWRLAQALARAGRSKATNPRAHASFKRFIVLVETHHREHRPVSRYANRLGMSPKRLNRFQAPRRPGATRVPACRGGDRRGLSPSQRQSAIAPVRQKCRSGRPSVQLRGVARAQNSIHPELRGHIENIVRPESSGRSLS